MHLSVWITYFIATIVLSLSPGPGVFSSISSGLHHGFRLEWLGVIYLIYLGIVTWRAAPKSFEEDGDDGAHTAREVFMRGFWVNATNPKGIILFAAILPQFIDVALVQAAQYAILAGTTFAVDLVIMMGYTALAAKVLRVMSDPRHLRWVNRGIGGAFVAAGVALASFRRAATLAAT